MATLSPALSNNSIITPTTTPTTSKIATLTPTTISTSNIKANSPSKAALTFQHDPPKFTRGQNKPRCSICGNVARSKCDYKSCKRCCAKAENPCTVHVLKQSGILPDKKHASTDQKSTDASPPGTSSRVSSYLNQLHGTQSPRRPLTRKEAVALNRWRYSKVKEYEERNVQVENEAFNRYMQNVSLLEEAFFVNSPDGPGSETSAMGPDIMVSGLKAELRSNPRRADNLRKRIQYIVDQGLSKLDSNEKDTKRQKRNERALAIDELLEKLKKARNEEDLGTCLNIKAHLFNPPEKGEKEQSCEDAPKPVESNCVLPRLWSRVEIDQETLHVIDVHFSSLDQIEDL